MRPPKVPPLRSSALVHAAHEPLRFLVEDCLGICPPGAPSEALTIGSAVHAVLNHRYGPGNPPITQTYDRLFSNLQSKARLGNVSDSTRLSWQETFAEDWDTGHLIADIAFASPSFTRILDSHQIMLAETPILLPPPTPPGYHESARVIAEIRAHLWYDLASAGNPGFVIQPDLALLDEARNELWILDAKTCDMPPRVRASTAPLELQPVHYLHVLSAMQACGLLVPFLDKHAPGHKVRPDTVVVGCCHALIQKPGIRVSKKTLNASGREAANAQYRERLAQWYASEGEFTHLRAEREHDGPAIDFAWTRYPTPEKLDWYGTAVQATLDYGDSFEDRVETVQYSSPPPEAQLRQYGKISWLLPFYRLPFREWPTIIQRERLIQQWRHELEPAPYNAYTGELHPLS